MERTVARLPMVNEKHKVKIMAKVLEKCIREFESKSFENYTFYYYDGQEWAKFEKKKISWELKIQLLQFFFLRKRNVWVIISKNLPRYILI